MFKFEEIKAKKFYYSDLYYDFILNFSKVSSNYFYDYSRGDTFKKRVEDISSSYDSSFRKKVAEILAKNNISYGCGIKTLENIKSLRDGSALVVIGGQQPGLFTGPIFIIYKIISIIKLSIFLSGLLKLKVIPVFWNASDDSNFTQVNTASFIDQNIEKIQITGNEPDFSGTGKRFSDIYLGKEMIAEKINQVMQLLPATDFRNDIKTFFESCIHSIENISLPDLFSVMIQKIFSDHGLIIIDPSSIDVKKLAVQVADYDIENSTRIQEAILRWGNVLKKAGYHSQLNPEKNALNFFLTRDGIRQKIYRENEGNFTFSGYKVKKSELIDMVSDDPSKISLNVALRPLFQDMLLPVICTVCGPGEVSYFAQLKEVYEQRGERSSIIYPRLSATIIENKVSRSIERTGIKFGDLEASKEENIDRYVQKSLNFDIEKLLKSFEDDIFLKINGLKSNMEKNGLETGSAFNRIRDNIGKETSVLNKKIMSVLKEKNRRLADDIDRVYLNIFPEGQLQERKVNVFNYINKYGSGFIKNLFELPDSTSNFHKFVFTGNG